LKRGRFRCRKRENASCGSAKSIAGPALPVTSTGKYCRRQRCFIVTKIALGKSIHRRYLHRRAHFQLVAPLMRPLNPRSLWLSVISGVKILSLSLSLSLSFFLSFSFSLSYLSSKISFFSRHSDWLHLLPSSLVVKTKRVMRKVKIFHGVETRVGEKRKSVNGSVR